MVRRSIELGVCKFNVNTEVRGAFVEALKEKFEAPQSPDLVDLLQAGVEAMQAVIAAKLRLFGSVDKA